MSLHEPKCHCEQQSDEAISIEQKNVGSSARMNGIASAPSMPRNDTGAAPRRFDAGP